MPEYVEPIESPVSKPDSDCPLVLTAFARSTIATSNIAISAAARGLPDPVAEINPETGAIHGQGFSGVLLSADELLQNVFVILGEGGLRRLTGNECAVAIQQEGRAFGIAFQRVLSNSQMDSFQHSDFSGAASFTDFDLSVQQVAQQVLLEALGRTDPAPLQRCAGALCGMRSRECSPMAAAL